MAIKQFKKIKNRLLFWFLTLSMLPLIITLFFVYIQQQRVLEKETFNKLEAIRELKADKVQGWLTERLGDMEATSKDYDLTDIEYVIYEKDISHPSMNNEDIINRLRSVLTNYQAIFQDYEEIFLLHPQTGKVIISTKKYMEGADKSANEYFTVVKENRNLHIKDVYYSKEINQNCMAFSSPVFCKLHDHKHMVGILVARVVLENSLYALLNNRTGLGETGETLIVNKDMVALNSLHWQKDAALALKITAEPAMRAAQGQTGLIKAKDYRGEEVLAAYSFIPEVNWGFVCKQDTRELNTPLLSLLRILLLLLIASAVIIIFSAIILSKTLSQPIVKLKRVAKEIEKGNYSIRVKQDSNDELGSLANSVNHMTRSIESNDTIQRGTSEISKTIIESSNISDFSDKILRELLTLTSSAMGAVYVIDDQSENYVPLISIGANQEMLKPFSAVNPEGELGAAISSGRIFLIEDIPLDTKFDYLAVAGNMKPKAILTIPVIMAKKTVSVISLVNLKEFSEESLDIVNQSWVLINQAYSNMINTEKMMIMNERLNNANEVLEKQKESLQVQTEELRQQGEELHETSLELQEQNVELEQQKKQLAHASKLKSQFLSNMSHELRTPLNSILALSELLQMNRNNSFNSDEVNHLAIIHKNGRLLLNQINDILDISKIEAGKMDIRIVPLSLKSALRDTYDSLLPLAEKKSLDFKLELPETLPIIETDAFRLSQILQNLVGNAIKFTDKGHVKISAKKYEEFVRINIEDTGIGISSDMLEAIFDEFHQVDGSTSRSFEGTGLGLAIAKKLAIILGGDIEVKSTKGEGSTFSLLLPILSAKVDSQYSFFERDFNDNESMPDENIDSSNKRLLVVEDNEAAIIQVQGALKRKGYQVDVARGGMEALNIVKKAIPDGIILDLMMPEMDGFEVLERIRGTQRTKNIPVLILTAKDLNDEDLSKLSANNIQQLVQKGSINLDGLYSKVNKMLNDSAAAEKLPLNNKEIEYEHTILMIEDNPDNMETLKAIIPDTYKKIEAFDGLEGLKAAVTKKPDLILLDINLPKIDGIELVGMLKHSEDVKNIPVIAVTARASEEDKKELMDYGCDDYLSKPIKPELLINMINKWLKK